jgi:hypothetical protein
LHAAKLVTGNEVGIESPAQVGIEAFCPVDVRDRDGHHLQLHVEIPRYRCFVAHLSIGHGDLLKIRVRDVLDSSRCEAISRKSQSPPRRRKRSGSSSITTTQASDSGAVKVR